VSGAVLLLSHTPFSYELLCSENTTVRVLLTITVLYCDGKEQS